MASDRKSSIWSMVRWTGTNMLVIGAGIMFGVDTAEDMAAPNTPYWLLASCLAFLASGCGLIVLASRLGGLPMPDFFVFSRRSGAGPGTAVARTESGAGRHISRDPESGRPGGIRILSPTP